MTGVVARTTRAVSSLLVGVMLAAAYLLGGSAATEDPPVEVPGSPAVSPGPGVLRLDGYCSSLYGSRADAYQPRDTGGWHCSVWRNGVWGLEEVNLIDACRWQAGADARIEREDGTSGTEPRLLCTL